MPEYTRTWQYTSEDYQRDAQLPPMPEGHKIDLGGDPNQPHNSRFTAMLMEAHQYAIGLTHPSVVNWVRVRWMWL